MLLLNEVSRLMLLLNEVSWLTIMMKIRIEVRWKVGGANWVGRVTTLISQQRPLMFGMMTIKVVSKETYFLMISADTWNLLTLNKGTSGFLKRNAFDCRNIVKLCWYCFLSFAIFSFIFVGSGDAIMSSYQMIFGQFCRKTGDETKMPSSSRLFSVTPMTCGESCIF